MPTKIKAIEPGLVRVSIDLTAYYDTFMQKECRMARGERFFKSSKQLAEELQPIFLADVNGISADSCWQTIKQNLAGNNEVMCQHLLNNKDGNEKYAKPLAVQALDIFFPELLKNSVDSILQTYYANKIEPPVELQMDIFCEITEENTMSFVIEDNGHGFSEEYCHNFLTYIEEATDQSTYASTKQENFPLSLGGTGNAMYLLGRFLLKGKLLNESGKFSQYDIPPNSTELWISNHDRGGARIKLSSPLDPIPQKPFSQDSEYEDGDEDEVVLAPF